MDKPPREDDGARIAAYSSYRLPPLMPQKFVDKSQQRADVPCGKCTLCCRTLIVPLAEEEYEQYEGHWGWITARDGKRLGRALLRRPDGACVYLDESNDEAPRAHHAARERGGMAARSARAATGDAGDRHHPRRIAAKRTWIAD